MDSGLAASRRPGMTAENVSRPGMMGWTAPDGISVPDW